MGYFKKEFQDIIEARLEAGDIREDILNYAKETLLEIEKTLGYGLPETIYQEAFFNEMSKMYNTSYTQVTKEEIINIYYKGTYCGFIRLDVRVGDYIFEFKSLTNKSNIRNILQTKNYCKFKMLEDDLGDSYIPILVNFSNNKLEIEEL